MNISDLTLKIKNVVDKFYIQGLGRKVTFANGNVIRGFYEIHESFSDRETVVEASLSAVIDAGLTGVGEVIKLDDDNTWRVTNIVEKDRLNRLRLHVTEVKIIQVQPETTNEIQN